MKFFTNAFLKKTLKLHRIIINFKSLNFVQNFLQNNLRSKQKINTFFDILIHCIKRRDRCIE